MQGSIINTEITDVDTNLNHQYFYILHISIILFQIVQLLYYTKLYCFVCVCISIFGTLIGSARNGVSKTARGYVGSVHISQLSLHQLKFTNRLIELFSLMNVRNHNIQRRSHQTINYISSSYLIWYPIPQRTSWQYQTLIIKTRHQYTNTIVNASHHLSGWHLTVVKH